MKRALFLFLVFFNFLASFSQVVNNLVVFCNEGEPFTLIMNGERYNETPQTRVRVEGLTLKQYQVKLIFKNPSLKDHSTKLTFFNTCYECEFALNKKGRRKHTMDWFAEKRIEGCGNAVNNNAGTTSYNTNTTYNTTNTSPTPTLVSTPITNLNTNSTLPGTNSNDPLNINTSNGTVNLNIGHEQFQLFKSDIIKEVSDIGKEAKALAMLKNGYLTSAQVKESISWLSTDNAKLNFAKKAYPQTKDKENYYLVVNAINSPDQRSQLQTYIQNYK